MHNKLLITEIDQIDCQEVLTQFSLSRNDSDKIHGIEKFERKEKTSKSFARNIYKDLIDIDANPDIEIPMENSPSSEMNLEAIFRNLGSILQNGIEKQSHKELNYEDSQKKKYGKS